MRPLAVRRVEYGFDSPWFVFVFYIRKMIAYVWGGLALIVLGCRIC